MDKETFKKIINLLLVDQNIEGFLRYCSEDIKFIVHPTHIASGTYDRKTIYSLFEHLEKSFPKWKETIKNIYHDETKKTFIVETIGSCLTINDIWIMHIIHYNNEDKIFMIDEKIDTLKLAEGNVGPRI